MKKRSTNKIAAARFFWHQVEGRAPLMRYGLLLFFTLLSSQLYAQVTVSGLVKDSQGATLPGVSVKLKGTAIASGTDAATT